MAAFDKEKRWFAGPLFLVYETREKLHISPREWATMTPRERNQNIAYVRATATMEAWEMYLVKHDRKKG